MSLSCYSQTRSARLIVWLLLPALMLAQWVGYAHRIEHAGWQDSYQLRPDPVSDKAVYSADKHSCSALDAATLGACLTSATPQIQLQRYALTRLITHFQSWLSLPKLHFSSRAPPRL